MSIQVASVSTSAATLRSEIDGWSFEDSALLVRNSLPMRASLAQEYGKIFIGYTPSPKDIPLYSTILEMLADGWELLGPPQRQEWTTADEREQPVHHEQWCWWLQRKRQTRSPA